MGSSPKKSDTQCTSKQLVGDIGEVLAQRWLAERGYLVVDENYLRPWGELDIVARKQDQLYFVEVKTVSRPVRQFPGEPGEIKDGYRPEERMHKRKQERMARAIQTYLSEQDFPSVVDFQCDLICVYLDREAKKAKIERLENIII